MKILEFSKYSSDIDLNEEEMSSIKEWVKKYEKYFNFHNTENFKDSVKEVAKDCVEKLGLPKKKKKKVRNYLETLYDLSDGLSVVMAPDAQFQYTNIDQVQRFQY